MGKNLISYIVILCLLFNSCVCGDTLSNTSALKRTEFRALIHKLAEDLRQDRLQPREVIKIAEDRIAELSTYPEVEPYIRALRKIIKIAKKRLQTEQDRPKAVIASIRHFFADEYQAGGKKTKTYENIIAPILEEYGLSIGLRILRLFGVISNDVKNNILRKVGKEKDLGLLRYIFLLGFRTIPILIGITSILLGVPPAMIAGELTLLALLSTILSMLSHNSIRSAFGALLVGTGIFYIFSIQALYSYLGIPLIILVPFLVHSTTWNQLIADIIINNIELKAMSSLMHSRDASDAYFCEADNEEISPHIKRILEDPAEKNFCFISGASDEGKTGRLDVSKWQAMVQGALTRLNLTGYSIVILRGVNFSGHYGTSRKRIYIPVEMLEIATPEILEDFIEHEYLYTIGKDEDYIRTNSEAKRPGVYEEAKRLYRHYIANRLAETVQDSPLLKAKIEDILKRVQAGESIKLTETQLHRLLWLIDRSKETDLVVEIAGLLNLILEPGYRGDVGHVIMAIEKELLEVLTENREKEKFKELIKDSQMAELVLYIFSQSRAWKAKRKIGPINITKWITTKRILPTQIKDILIAEKANSTLIIYPANKNELGVQLPNLDYRVYRIPRCIDIDKERKLDVIFKQAEAIKTAEGIVSELEKGEIRSEISFNPEVFFWVQNILKKKLGDKPERYALERRLLLSILFQSYPDLDPEFKKQIEEFSPSGAHLGKWLDLIKADRFLLSKGVYQRPQLFETIRQLARKAEEIYTQIDESSSRIIPGGEYGIEMNSSLHVCSSLVALARIISEFDIDKDFDKPEKIAARFIFYFVEGRKDADLSELLRFLKEELELTELDEALAQSESLEDFRKGILGDILIEFFRRIPKADIHHHLDGCISPELAFKIIKKYPKLMKLYGSPKSPEDLKPYIEFDYKGEGDINWDDLWKKFELFRDILNTNLNEVTFLFKESSLEDFYNDGLTLIEHKISIITPGQDPGIDPASVLEAAVRGLIEAEEAAGGKLQTGLIPCIWKDPRFILGTRYAEVAEKARSDPGIIIHEAREEALRQVKIVVDLKKRWEKERPEYAQYLIGIDTVGDEKDYIREVTAPALQYAAENGLNITEHLGENWNKGELKQALLRIKQGIESGIIKRIGHATALGIETRDEELRGLQEEIKELIRGKGIHIETCPSSNKLLAPERSIPGYKDHPVAKFYRELGNVSINTDDSRILHTRGLSGEFMKVWLANPDLKYSDIQRIIENGFRATFIDRRAKDGTKINLTELLSSPWDEDDPIVIKFIQEAIGMEATKELMQLSDNELEHRLYQALQEPGIGLPDSPAPSKNWWRHVIIHLTGTAIGMRESDELRRKLEPIRQRYRYIQNLLQEWLRRNWKIIQVVDAMEILLMRYSNVHRGMGQHSQISTHLYERAREIVGEFLGVDLNKYTVIFGSDLERIKKNLIPDADYKIVDPEISSLFGITAVAVRKEDLRKGAPYEPGGGTVALVLEEEVVWADSPDRFEPGTPNIAGAIALAKALWIGLKPQQETTTVDPDRLIKEIFYQEAPGEKSLADLRQDLIGWQAGVPTRNGYLPYVNFDNGASTPTFRAVFDAYKKALRLPASVRDILIEEVRRICRDFFNAPQGEYDVIFTKNTTEGINIIAHNLELAPGSVVLNSFLEHNSNELPWRYMPGVSQERLSVDENGFFDLNELEDKLRSNPKIKLVALSGASNVLGSVNDIKEIARISHKYGAMVLIDAAQLIAHRPIDMHEWGIDFIAFSGHKAYAPFGASGIVVRRGRLKEGIKDIDNTAGITALGRALLMLKRIRMEDIIQHERELTEYTLERLKEIDGIVIYGTTDPEDLARRLGVISFNIKDLAHALVAGILAEEGGIGVRSGCFCAHLLMQKMLGISEETVLSTRDELKRGIRPQMPGEVRISLGLYNTKEEIDRMIEILKKIAAGEYDLTRYQYEKETGHYYTRKYRARLDIFIHQIEEQVFGISHYKDAIDLSNISDVNRRLLGNKGAKFGIFNKSGMNYPNGFIIDSDTIRNTNDQEFLDNLFFPWIKSQIRALEVKTGKVFGNPQNPLLLAVRSSPEFSMPAILSTILNVGINDEIVQNLAQRYGEFYAYDTYRRFIEEYGISVLGLNKGDFEMIFQSAVEKGMKAVVDEYKKYIASNGKEIPQDVWVQLEKSMKVVIISWYTPRAKLFRQAEGISREAGFSVIAQEMVFGNLNSHSGAGVLFTRNPNTGKDEIFGNYLTGSQGEDIVSGRLRGGPIQDLRDEFPDIYKRLVEIRKTLEKSQSWPQEIEFVVEDNKLYILQARDIEFAAPIRETMLKQLEEEGITNRYQAIDRLEKWQLRQRLRGIFRVKTGTTVNPLLKGTGSTPGAIKGRLTLNIDKAYEYAEQGDGVILLLTPQSKGILRNLFVLPHVGLITTYGNESFHEAVLCRLSGVPAIICVDEDELRTKFKEGDLIVLDGDNNRIFVAEEDVLEEVLPITDITYGIDIIEYQRGFDKGKEGFSYEELVELNVLYREKFLTLISRLKGDLDSPALRREAFIANLEKHLVHELLHKAGEALGKTREEVNTQLAEVIRLVDLGKIIHEMGDFILFEKRVTGDQQKAEAMTVAEGIVRENPGSEIRIEKLDDRFGAELVKVIKPGEAEILYKDDYLWYPYDNERDKKLEERRADAKRVLEAFPGARLLERHAVTYIHDGGGTEITYYFIVYRQKEDISGRLETVLEELLSLITIAELDEGDEKLACVITALTNEYNKAQGTKRILIGMLLARLGKESRDLIVLSKPLPVKNVPNIVTWTSLDELKELIRERKTERTLFILDNETRIQNFSDFQIGREYDVNGIGRSFFVPMVPDVELLQLLSLVQEIFTADLKSGGLSPELKRLLAGEDLEELRPVKLLQDLEQARDELIELIRSS